MAKAIPWTIVDKFRQFCRKTLADDDGGYFTLEDFDEFSQQDEQGRALWEFHAANYDPPESYDIYALFASVTEYEIEVHGHDEFWIMPRTFNDLDAVPYGC